MMHPTVALDTGKRYFAAAILFYILVNGIYPPIERWTLWGEFFCLVSLFAIARFRFPSIPFQNSIILLVCLWLFFFPIYGYIISKLLWAPVFEPLYLLRHLAFFYYAIFFFVAFKYGDLFLEYLKKYGIIFLTMATLAILLKIGIGITSTSVLSFILMGLSQRKDKPHHFYIGLTIFLGLLLYSSGHGTNKVNLASFFALSIAMIIARYWSLYIPRKLSAILIIGIFGLSLLWTYKVLTKFYLLTTQLALLGESLAALGGMSNQYHTDLGGFWRLALWSHLYGRFIHHPLGVGIGTPLFEPWLDGFVHLHLYRSNENYFQGAHNSFVTLIARLGAPCLLFFSLLFHNVFRLVQKVFQQFRYHPFKTAHTRLLFMSLFSLVSIIINASFNIAIESPLYAGIFWFSLGLFTKLYSESLVDNTEFVAT